MMNKKNKRCYIAIVILLLMGVFWIINHKTAPPFQTKLSITERDNVDNFLKYLKTRCIGRYLVDLPASYIVADTSLERINGLIVSTKRMFPPSFQQQVHLREKELLSTKIASQENMPYLKNKHSLPNGLEGVIFERGKGEIKPDSFRVFEAHMYNNGVAFRVESAFTNASDKRYDFKRSIDPDIYIDNSLQKMNELIDLLMRIQGRDEDYIPTTPGTCIQNAFITDNGRDKEEIDILFEGSEKSQLRFGISTDNFTHEEDSLLERSDTIATKILPSNGRVLRKGIRRINQLYAEELLAVGDYSFSGNKRYDFILLTNEKTGSYKNPVFSFELLNDEWMTLSYSQNEIISFWDAIIQTIRVRPGAF